MDWSLLRSALIPVIIVLVIYFYREFLKKRKLKDTHIEVMDSGTKKERLTFFSLSILYLISFLILTISLTYFTYQTRINTFDTVEIVYSNFEWSTITLLPWLFISIFILALPYELLLFRFIPDRVPKEQQPWHLRKTYIAIFITLILMLPLVFLLFDFYVIITPQSIVKDDFLSFKAKEYSFDNISGIELNGYLRKTRLNLDVTVYPKNGQQFRLFDSGNLPTNDELHALRFLKQQNIPISIVQLPSERDYEHIKVDDQNADEARTIFEEIKKIAES